LPDEVLGFERTDGRETLRFFFNLGDASVTLPVDPGWTEVFPLGGDVDGATVTLTAVAAVVFAHR
jgi:hypothetical protein